MPRLTWSPPSPHGCAAAVASSQESYDKAKIQVFGDAVDERDPEWDGALTFADYIKVISDRAQDRWSKRCSSSNSGSSDGVIKPWIVLKLRTLGARAKFRVEHGQTGRNSRETLLQGKAFSMSEAFRNLQQNLLQQTLDIEKRMDSLQQHSARMEDRLMAALPSAGLPPLKLPNGAPEAE